MIYYAVRSGEAAYADEPMAHRAEEQELREWGIVVGESLWD